MENLIKEVIIMTFIQYRGPFNDNDTLTLSEFSSSGSPIKLRYLQIGIEHPHSIPIFEFEETEKGINYPYIVSINNSTYLITERDVLEFANLSIANLTIKFLQDSPYLIVNVAYEEAD